MTPANQQGKVSAAGAQHPWTGDRVSVWRQPRLARDVVTGSRPSKLQGTCGVWTPGKVRESSKLYGKSGEFVLPQGKC